MTDPRPADALRPDFFTLVALLMAAIAAVDYALGATAEYLNAWEVVRHTLPPAVRAHLPQVAEGYFVGQARFGPLALPMAWLAWVAEAAVVAAVVRLAQRAILRARRAR